jgi:hypothetical protein
VSPKYNDLPLEVGDPFAAPIVAGCQTCRGERSGKGAYGKWTCPHCTQLPESCCVCGKPANHRPGGIVCQSYALGGRVEGWPPNG